MHLRVDGERSMLCRLFNRFVDHQNYTLEVLTEQWILDRTLKHLRKLRWIGKEQEAEHMAHVLRSMRLPQLLGNHREGANEVQHRREIAIELPLLPVGTNS